MPNYWYNLGSRIVCWIYLVLNICQGKVTQWNIPLELPCFKRLARFGDYNCKAFSSAFSFSSFGSGGRCYSVELSAVHRTRNSLRSGLFGKASAVDSRQKQGVCFSAFRIMLCSIDSSVSQLPIISVKTAKIKSFSAYEENLPRIMQRC